MKSPRQLAYDTLMRVLYDDAYSTLAIDAALQEEKLDKSQAAFASALFYGVLERGISLDSLLERYIKRGIRSLDREVLIVLRMGLYQLIYMDSVPDNAAVDESVRLTAYARKTSAKGLVNAVLRSFVRDGKPISFTGKTPWERAAAEYACPLWILQEIADDYGEEQAIAYAAASLGRPPLFARVNTLKTDSEKLCGWLQARGVQAERCAAQKDCLLLSDTGSIDRNPQYRQGLYHIQDLSSQLCVAALAPEPGERLVDVCAAPGSKSFTAAEWMKNEGEIHSFDLYSRKVERIADGAKRLGITILHPAVQDATAPARTELIGKADRVLCDVPCSGLGVIRRKPEIKYKPPGDFSGLPELQLRILTNASHYVRPGGRLVYSTCTVRREENERVVERFLAQNSCFHPLQLPIEFGKIKQIGDSLLGGAGRTFWPSPQGGDGFFFALLERDAE